VGEEVENILLMDEKGLHEYLSESDGIIEIAENQINYVSASRDKTFRNIEGIFIDPPNHSVMDSFYDVQHYLDQGTPALIVFIDGFSYYEYENFINQWPESFLASLEPFDKATSVYKPVTNAGYAAMVTGQPPSENGILNRSYREVKTETIFDYADKKGLSHFVIEGNTSIITLNTELILSNDVNDDGYSDDEIFGSGLEYVKAGYDLGLVHFHSVDDYGHLTGANSDEVMERIRVIDGYTRQLVENWNGKVIIVADHGMHSTPDGGGSHGEFRVEDLLIPYQI
jgi:predicted AlkP superfamily pyrophosphatase or phosphodiesterase